MKNPVEYIKQELNIFCSRFLGMSVRYAYEYSSNFHIIEIEPYEEFKNKDEFCQWATEFWGRFECEFEDENILISEESCLNDMSNLIFENAKSFSKEINEKIYLTQSYSFGDFECIDPIEIETQIFSPSSSPWSIDQFSCA